jgi:hypothetical protein
VQRGGGRGGGGGHGGGGGAAGHEYKIFCTCSEAIICGRAGGLMTFHPPEALVLIVIIVPIALQPTSFLVCAHRSRAIRGLQQVTALVVLQAAAPAPASLVPGGAPGDASLTSLLDPAHAPPVRERPQPAVDVGGGGWRVCTLRRVVVPVLDFFLLPSSSSLATSFQGTLPYSLCTFRA